MEYLYAFYILSGVVKAFLNYLNISLNIDFTLLLASLLFFGLLLHILIKGVLKYDVKSVFSIYLLLLFYLWINITILYSPSLNYSYQKSFLFITNLLAFIIPLLYGKFDTRKFIKIFVILSPILGVLFLALYSQVFYIYDEAAQAFKSAYLSVPLFCGLCVLIIIIMEKLFSPIFSGLLISINALIVILAGARGPIIFTVAILVLYSSTYLFSGLVVSIRKNKHNMGFKAFNTNNIVSFTFVVSIILFLLLFVPDIQILLDRSHDRMMGLINFTQEESSDESALARVNLYAFSSNLIFDNVKGMIFGYGLGSYGILSTGVDERSYPHNIILEIWLETGLIGILSILLFFGFIIYSSRRNLRNNSFLWLVLFLFLNAMKSGSLVDLRVLFGFLALMALHSKFMQSRFRRSEMKLDNLSL